MTNTTKTLTIEVRKCPTCGGAVRYDAQNGTLACSWCGNTYKAQNLEVRRISATPEGYVCPECGAQLVMDSFVASVSCPYCGNHEVMPQRLEGEFAPDLIIPFCITKMQAIENFHAFLADKDYLPDGFAQGYKILGIQGTYVPFWLKNGIVDFDFTFISCDMGKVGHMIYGDHHRAGTYTFAQVPADGSANMPDDMMDSLEPYDYSALRPFSVEYLPGFVAEHYTVEDEKVNERIDRRVKNSAILACRTTILDDFWKSTNADSKRSCAVVHHTGSKQALFPVWLFVVLFEGERYLVGVNGQTGKVAVNLPIDKTKQNRKTSWEGIKSLLIMLPMSVLLIVIGALTLPSALFDEPVVRDMYLKNVGIGECIVPVGFIFIGAAALVCSFIYEFVLKRSEIKHSMHNVREATHAQDYDVEGLSLTIREAKKGPVQHANRWPE